MSRESEQQHLDPNYSETLPGATSIYRLHNSNMTNPEVASHLNLEHRDGDFEGVPNCCFFSEGYIVAIRTKKDEVSLFHLFQRFRHSMTEIGTLIE